MKKDIEQIVYTITGFDEQNRVIHVEFQDEGYANIALMDVPTTEEELDAAIRQFAPHKETVAMTELPAPDFSLITNKIGQARATRRFSRQHDFHPTQNNEIELADEPDLSASRADEVEFLKALVRNEVAAALLEMKTAE